MNWVAMADEWNTRHVDASEVRQLDEHSSWTPFLRHGGCIIGVAEVACSSSNISHHVLPLPAHASSNTPHMRRATVAKAVKAAKAAKAAKVAKVAATMSSVEM